MGAVKAIDQEIEKYLSYFNARQKQVVLSVVKGFAARQEDWWDKISEEQQKAIDKSLREMKTSILTPHEEVMKVYKK